MQFPDDHPVVSIETCPYANERQTALSKAGELAKKAHDSALRHSAQALNAIEALLPDLSAVAGIQNPLPPAEE